MLLAAIFIFLGVGIISKKSVQISSKRTLSGKKVLKLGILFIITGIFNLAALYIPNQMIGAFTFLLEVISVLSVIYLVAFSAGDNNPNINR